MSRTRPPTHTDIADRCTTSASTANGTWSPTCACPVHDQVPTSNTARAVSAPSCPRPIRPAATSVRSESSALPAEVASADTVPAAGFPAFAALVAFVAFAGFVFLACAARPDFAEPDDATAGRVAVTSSVPAANNHRNARPATTSRPIRTSTATPKSVPTVEPNREGLNALPSDDPAELGPCNSNEPTALTSEAIQPPHTIRLARRSRRAAGQHTTRKNTPPTSRARPV